MATAGLVVRRRQPRVRWRRLRAPRKCGDSPVTAGQPVQPVSPPSPVQNGADRTAAVQQPRWLAEFISSLKRQRRIGLARPPRCVKSSERADHRESGMAATPPQIGSGSHPEGVS